MNNALCTTPKEGNMANRQQYARVDIREVEALLGHMMLHGEEYERVYFRFFCEQLGIPYQEEKVQLHYIAAIVAEQKKGQADTMKALAKQFAKKEEE
jgi:hypothetical protein